MINGIEVIQAAQSGDSVCDSWLTWGQRINLLSPSGLRLCVPAPQEFYYIMAHIAEGHNMRSSYNWVADTFPFEDSPTVRTCYPPQEYAYCVEGIYKKLGSAGGLRNVDQSVCKEFYTCLSQIDRGYGYTGGYRAMIADGVFVPSETEKICIKSYLLNVKANLREAYDHCCSGSLINIYPWWTGADAFILNGIVATNDDMYNLIKMSYNAYIAGQVINPNGNGDGTLPPPTSKDNMLLYVGLGVLAVLALTQRGATG